MTLMHASRRLASPRLVSSSDVCTGQASQPAAMCHRTWHMPSSHFLELRHLQLTIIGTTIFRVSLCMLPGFQVMLTLKGKFGPVMPALSNIDNIFCHYSACIYFLIIIFFHIFAVLLCCDCVLCIYVSKYMSICRARLRNLCRRIIG